MAFRNGMTLGDFLKEARDAEPDSCFKNTGCVKTGKTLPAHVLGRISASGNEVRFFTDLQAHVQSKVLEIHSALIAMADKTGELAIVYSRANGGAVGIKAPEETRGLVRQIAVKYGFKAYSIE